MLGGSSSGERVQELYHSVYRSVLGILFACRMMLMRYLGARPMVSDDGRRQRQTRDRLVETSCLLGLACVSRRGASGSCVRSLLRRLAFSRCRTRYGGLSARVNGRRCVGLYVSLVCRLLLLFAVGAVSIAIFVRRAVLLFCRLRCHTGAIMRRGLSGLI